MTRTEYADKGISPGIKQEFFLVPRPSCADRLALDGSVLQFHVVYKENFGVFPVDLKEGHVLDNGDYGAVKAKEASIVLTLDSPECVGGALIASTDFFTSDDGKSLGLIYNSFEVTEAEGRFHIKGSEKADVYVEDPDAVAQGIVGTVRWKLDRDGLLTVFGEGNMAGRRSREPWDVPWEAYKNDIRRVVIEDGVANVGARSFQGTMNLEEASIGNTVSVIGSGAFFHCPKLRHVYVPASVRSIGKQAFAEDGMLSSIEVDPDNPNFTAAGGMLYSKDQTVLISCSEDVPVIRVPEGVTEIQFCAFRDHSKLDQVALPNSLTFIEVTAFLSCYNLKTVIYYGTPEEWEAISIDKRNDELTAAELICMGTGSRPAGSEMISVLDDGELKVQYKDRFLLIELSGIQVDDTYILDRAGNAAGLSEYIWSVEFSDDDQTYKMSTAYFTKEPGANREGSIDDMAHHFMVKEPWGDHETFRSLAEAEVQHTENSICWRAELPEDCSIDYDSIDSFNVEIRGYAKVNDLKERHYLPANLTNPSDRSVGRTLYMGRYEQDDCSSDGTEPIEWIVLSVEPDRALLMSRYGLDCLPYQQYGGAEIHWSSCDLRKWLKEEFYDAAFSEEEQNRMLAVMLPNTDDLTGDFYTEDFVFLLSLSEAERYVKEKEYAVCEPSEYAIGKGANDFLREESWWLRTPGSENGKCSVVDISGKPIRDGNHCWSDTACVRPCFG